jgi:hypothetical protein
MNFAGKPNCQIHEDQKIGIKHSLQEKFWKNTLIKTEEECNA